MPAVAAGGDVADEAAKAGGFDTAERELGGVDAVVHTAGIMPLSPITETDLDIVDRVQRTNVRGTLVVDRLAARHVREGGAVIDFSASVTRLQIPDSGAYAASKGAVEALTPILARAWQGRDITVNARRPGPDCHSPVLPGPESRGH